MSYWDVLFLFFVFVFVVIVVFVVVFVFGSNLFSLVNIILMQGAIFIIFFFG